MEGPLGASEAVEARILIDAIYRERRQAGPPQRRPPGKPSGVLEGREIGPDVQSLFRFGTGGAARRQDPVPAWPQFLEILGLAARRARWRSPAKVCRPRPVFLAVPSRRAGHGLPRARRGRWRAWRAPRRCLAQALSSPRSTISPSASCRISGSSAPSSMASAATAASSGLTTMAGGGWRPIRCRPPIPRPAAAGSSATCAAPPPGRRAGPAALQSGRSPARRCARGRRPRSSRH